MIKVNLNDDIGTKVKTQNFNFTKDVLQMFCLHTRITTPFFFSVCFLMSASFIQNSLFQLNLFHMERQEKVVRKLQDFASFL